MSCLHIYIRQPGNKKSTAFTTNQSCETFLVCKTSQVTEHLVTQCFESHLYFHHRGTQFLDDFRLLNVKPPDAAANRRKVY
jgi:hypothetical protein